MASLSGGGLHATDSLITSTLQKHIFREVKIWDMGANNPDALRYVAGLKRWAINTGTAKTAEEDGEDVADEVKGPGGEMVRKPDLPTSGKGNPLLVALYGQICISAKSYQSAICEFGCLGFLLVV